ncbi:hypothetical protein JOL62DRAFT_184470 [Phyllosticta paracitricarpa]|uniref:Uncharacterized protein n=1 Tax=Phyllosticta paracitricarpa TaxID=2016321 RepID=A0ABR1N4Y4_9PEZI
MYCTVQTLSTSKQETSPVQSSPRTRCLPACLAVYIDPHPIPPHPIPSCRYVRGGNGKADVGAEGKSKKHSQERRAKGENDESKRKKKEKKEKKEKKIICREPRFHSDPRLGCAFVLLCGSSAAAAAFPTTTTTTTTAAAASVLLACFVLFCLASWLVCGT